MSFSEALLPEFDQEAEATRRVLERVPDGNLDWKPHEKSMTLGRLASHVAELTSWTKITLEQDEFDMAPPGAEPYAIPMATTSGELLDMFDSNLKTARETIRATSDEAFMETWTLKKAGEALFSAPKIGVLRRFVMNHLIHHRGQLTVYLRLNDVAVPSTFGPTADEQPF